MPRMTVNRWHPPRWQWPSISEISRTFRTADRLATLEDINDRNFSCARMLVPMTKSPVESGPRRASFCDSLATMAR